MPEERNSHILHAIKAYGKNLLGFIRKRVKNDADAEDILQDVWYQFSALVNSEPIEQTGAWLYKVARNKITDKYKKKSETLLDDLFTDDAEDDERHAQRPLGAPAGDHFGGSRRIGVAQPEQLQRQRHQPEGEHRL